MTPVSSSTIEVTIESIPTEGTSGEYPETIFAYNHSGSVESAPVVKSDKGKFPQLNKNAKSPAETTPGQSRGPVISFMTVQVEAPISRAASSRDGSKLYARIAIIRVAMGEIQTRCATTAVFQVGMIPRALNHISNANPSTA